MPVRLPTIKIVSTLAVADSDRDNLRDAQLGGVLNVSTPATAASDRDLPVRLVSPMEKPVSTRATAVSDRDTHRVFQPSRSLTAIATSATSIGARHCSGFNPRDREQRSRRTRASPSAPGFNPRDSDAPYPVEALGGELGFNPRDREQ